MKRSGLVVLAASGAVLITGLALMPSAAASESAKSSKCTIVGTPGRDVLEGTGGDDVICGRGGGDAIFGLGGNDILRGGAGDDALIGGEGDDKLVGGQGDDRTEQDPQPNGDENWQINAKTGYRVLVDTKIEWRVKAKSENCTADTSNWDNTRTASDQVFTQRALITANNSPGRSCAYERSYATWTVTVRQPGGEVVTAEVKITSGPPNGLVHVGDAECTVPSGWRCRTDSDWVFAGTGSVPNPWVAIGNM